VNPAQSTNRIVVRLTDDAGRSGLADLLKALPAATTIVRELDQKGLAVLQVPPGTDVTRVVAELKRSPLVVYAEPLFLDRIS
jgi:hypothetical protein